MVSQTGVRAFHPSTNFASGNSRHNPLACRYHPCFWYRASALFVRLTIVKVTRKQLILKVICLTLAVCF
jgi:hypothetical protein